MAKGQTSTVARSEKIKDSRFHRLNWSAAFFQVLCMGGGGGQQIIMTYYDKPFYGMVY